MDPTIRFGTAINCIDGRAQIPVTDWMKRNCHVDYVDMITVPGGAYEIASGGPASESLVRYLQISRNAHGSTAVAVAKHFDCVAVPGDFEEKKDAILRAADFLSRRMTGMRIVGLYVNEWGSVDVITDTAENSDAMRSFL